MRDIRFRAWHKTEKRMFKVYHLSWHFGIFLIGDKDAAEGRRCGSGEVELMQFTGLLDKTGREIYEGDIVWNTVFPNSRRHRYVIEWAREEDEQLVMVGFIARDAPTWQIIGNIYENPELLID